MYTYYIDYKQNNIYIDLLNYNNNNIDISDNKNENIYPQLRWWYVVLRNNRSIYIITIYIKWLVNNFQK